MRYLILIALLLFSGCASVRIKDTCDSYCLRTGGMCHHIEQGERRYNTVTGAYEEKPTYFECRYNN